METLREFRRRRGWSQKDLAEESGVGQDTISGIESGRHEPRPSTLRKLAEALDVEVGDFFREPALPGKAEAPEAGRSDTSETIATTVHDLVIKQDRREAQALNRLGESQLPQESYGHEDHKAMMYLLEFPKGTVEEAYIDLMRSHIDLERKNAQLREEVAELRDQLKEREQAHS